MTPWKTWLAHALLVVPVTVAWSPVLTLVLGPFWGPWMSALLATWGYVWREGEQLQKKFMRVWARGFRWWELLRGFWREVNLLDSTLDVVSPALSASIVASLMVPLMVRWV